MNNLLTQREDYYVFKEQAELREELVDSYINDPELVEVLLNEKKIIEKTDTQGNKYLKTVPTYSLRDTARMVEFCKTAPDLRECKMNNVHV